MKTEKKPPSEIKRKHGGPRPGAGRKPGSLNKLTLQVAGEQRRTRESRARMLLRVLNQGRIRKYKLTIKDLVRLAKEAAPHFARPMGYVRVNVKYVSGRYVRVDKDLDAQAPPSALPLVPHPDSASERQQSSGYD